MVKSKDPRASELIQKVQSIPALWDLRSTDYKNQELKQRKWNELAEQLKYKGITI